LRFQLAVILIALAVLFSLTTMALVAGEQIRHPIRVGLALTALLVLGLALLAE
jgi:hypothetical protein